LSGGAAGGALAGDVVALVGVVELGEVEAHGRGGFVGAPAAQAEREAQPLAQEEAA
jgi:hypothetical protein